MPAKNQIGPQYRKSLQILLKGPLGIHERKDVVRYRALQVMGLVDGVGVRCVTLTKAGRNLLATGILAEPKVEPVLDLPAIPPMINIVGTDEASGEPGEIWF